MKSKYVIFLLLLAVLGCTTESRRAAMRGVLDHAQQQNLDYDSITNVDSIALAAEFFDRHGTPNEQMRAHYILGRTYADRGEMPQALNAYTKIYSLLEISPNPIGKVKSQVHPKAPPKIHLLKIREIRSI